jgi:hypothetical protein
VTYQNAQKPAHFVEELSSSGDFEISGKREIQSMSKEDLAAVSPSSVEWPRCAPAMPTVPRMPACCSDPWS